MANLLFFDQGHKYTLDGEELPSVSEICRFLSREIYGDVSQYHLDHAAERGTAIHKACEALDKFGSVDVQDDILPYVQAYLTFRKEHKAEWDKIEYTTYHKELGYAGTLDRLGKLDGKASILDIKTSYTIHNPMASAQLNLYRKMMEANGYKVEALYILHLKKDGTYKLKQFEFDDTVPDALLTLHNTLKKKKTGGLTIPGALQTCTYSATSFTRSF